MEGVNTTTHIDVQGTDVAGISTVEFNEEDQSRRISMAVVENEMYMCRFVADLSTLTAERY